MTNDKSSKDTDQQSAPTTPNKLPENTVNSSKAVKSKVEASARTAPPAAKRSLVAIFALLFALLALAACGGLYYWFTLQQQQLNQQLLAISKQNNSALEQKVSQELQQQRQNNEQQYNALLDQNARQIQSKIGQLDDLVGRLTQRNPSDWLVQEAEYLIRVAARTLWLEQQTVSAIKLLQSADQRLAELNDPQFLPVREAVNQDIEALSLLPELETEQAILSLLGLAKQVNQLVLADLQPEKTNNPELVLSDDLNDWQSNLKKSWQAFLNDFIIPRHRKGNLEPLLTPAQQQNLYENLSLKLQQAQWAAAKGQVEIYQQTLSDASNWLKQYFDLNHAGTNNFIDRLTQLKTRRITVDYPQSLSSHGILRAVQRQVSNANVRPTALPTDKLTMQQEGTH